MTDEEFIRESFTGKFITLENLGNRIWKFDAEGIEGTSIYNYLKPREGGDPDVDYALMDFEQHDTNGAAIINEVIQVDREPDAGSPGMRIVAHSRHAETFHFRENCAEGLIRLYGPDEVNDVNTWSEHHAGVMWLEFSMSAIECNLRNYCNLPASVILATGDLNKRLEKVLNDFNRKNAEGLHLPGDPEA